MQFFRILSSFTISRKRKSYLSTEEEHIYAVDEDGNYMILNDDGTPFDIKAAYTEARDKGYLSLSDLFEMKKIIIPMNGWESLMKKI